MAYEAKFKDQCKLELEKAAQDLKQAQNKLAFHRNDANHTISPAQTKSRTFNVTNYRYSFNPVFGSAPYASSSYSSSYTKDYVIPAKIDTEGQAKAIKEWTEKVRMAEMLYEAKRRRYELVAE